LVGSDPAAKVGEIPLRSVQLWFAAVTYLGGFPEDLRIPPTKSNLAINEDGLHLQSHVFVWSQVSGVTIDGGEIAKNKIGAVLAFGVLGGPAAKGTADRAFLSLRRHDGATGYFQFENISPQALRAKVAPVLFQMGIPFLDDPLGGGSDKTDQPVSPLSIADELAKLAQLRDAGVLTEEEFAEQKAKLLG